MKVSIFKTHLEKFKGHLSSFEEKYKTIFFLLNSYRNLKTKS